MNFIRKNNHMFRRLGLAGKISAALVLGAAISNEAMGQCSVTCGGLQQVFGVDQEIEADRNQSFEAFGGSQKFTSKTFQEINSGSYTEISSGGPVSLQINSQNVGIGTTSPSRKLTVDGGDGYFVDGLTVGTANQLNNSTMVVNNTSTVGFVETFNVDGRNVSAGSGAFNIRSRIQNNGSGYAVAVRGDVFESNNASALTAVEGAVSLDVGSYVSANAIGVYGRVVGANAYGSLNSMGVFGKADAGTNRYGGYFEGGSINTVGSRNISLYANGNNVTVGNEFMISDQKFKENIIEVEASTSRIMNLRPVNYRFKESDEFSHIHFDRENLQYGFIAQELQEVFPEFVMDAHHPAQVDEEGNIIKEGVDYLAVNYTALIPVMVGMLQEQQRTIETQEARIEILEARLEQMESNTGIQMLEPNDGPTGYYLHQNHPNPFSDRTTIEYGLPESYEKAELLVTDMSGRQISKLILDGSGTQTIGYESLNGPGMYLYALVVDGEVLVSKRMIVE